MREKLTGIPVLTSAGKGALRPKPAGLAQKCVYCLVSVDGRKDFEELRSKLRFVMEFDAIFWSLLEGHYIEVKSSNKVTLKNIVEKKLGKRGAAPFIFQINRLFDQYGEDLVNNLAALEYMVHLYCKKPDADELLKAFEGLSRKSLNEVRS